MPTQFINLQQKFSFEAKSAFERLLTQTLWDAHPASFYHSATQEIIALTKYYLRKSQPSYSPNHYISLVWKVGDSTQIDYAEGINIVGRGPFTVCEYIKESWRITIQIKSDGPEEEIREIFQPFLKNFISDIYGLFGAYLMMEKAQKDLFSCVAHLGFENLKNVVNTMTSAINSFFKRLTGETISSRIMLYYAPEQGKEDGFLFYVSYDLPDDSGWKSYPSQNADSVFESLKYLFFKKEITDEQEQAKLAGQLEVIRGHISKNFACIKNSETKDFNELRSELLTHPASFLTDKLRASPDLTCPQPICYQPKGIGSAGLVAKSGITYVVQSVSEARELDMQRILIGDRLPYALMRIIEGGIEVKGGKRGMVTPLYGKGQLIGVLYATKDENGTNFINSTQIEVIESLAHKVGTILQEIRDYEFYRCLIQAKESVPPNQGAEKILEAIVAEIKKKIRFVMNVYDVDFEPLNCNESGYNPSLNRTVNKVEFGTVAGKDSALQLFLPAIDQKRIYVVTMTVDKDDFTIFETHRERHELFFNYCWGITGYISPPVSIPGDTVQSTETNK